MKKSLTFVLTAALCLSLAACGGGAGSLDQGAASDGEGFERITIKASYATSEQGMDGVACAKFAELVSERTDGAVAIQGFGGAQLASGDMDRMVELLIQGGAYDMCVLSEGVMEGINPEFYALEVPFAFKGYEEVYERVDSPEGQQWLTDEFAKADLTYLASLGNGIAQMTNSKRAVYEPSDLNGLRFRVYGDSDYRLMRALGADAFSMSFSELYSALQQGTVDGQINGLQTINSANLQEVQKYCTMVNMTYSGYHIVVNSGAWNNYSPELQAVLRECAREAALYARERLFEAEAELRGEFEDAGVIFCDPTDAQLDMFKEKALPVARETISTLSPRTVEVFGL